MEQMLNYTSFNPQMQSQPTLSCKISPILTLSVVVTTKLNCTPQYLASVVPSNTCKARKTFRQFWTFLVSRGPHSEIENLSILYLFCLSSQT